ncbi:hypothetical protein BC830DRAFT_383356 [Chytriomyces sp. MP71]|nr:hypothetical protein BC830DRAFT_383356 [Chytriomyces sp. MP71]
MMQTSQDSDIPHPILLSIFNVLDPVSLSRIAAVNHTWNRLSSASLQWHRHLLALKNHGLFPDDVQLTKWRLGTESTYAIDTSSRTAPVETLNVTTMKAQYVAWWEDHIRHGVLARLMEQHECNVEGVSDSLGRLHTAVHAASDGSHLRCVSNKQSTAACYQVGPVLR